MTKLSRQCNTPNIRFFIEIRGLYDGVLIESYHVDQVAKPSSSGVEAIQNVMERHCDVMYRKTGLQYLISGWQLITPEGDLEDL